MLKQGVPPQDAWLENVGQWLRWGPKLILVQECPPLVPLGEALMEVKDGAGLVQEDCAMAEESVAAEWAT